jgi:hypothetical protein
VTVLTGPVRGYDGEPLVNFHDQICATVRAMGTGVPEPIEIDGQVIATPSGWQYPIPVYSAPCPVNAQQWASYMMGRPFLNDDMKFLLLAGLILIALALVTRK